MQDPRRNPREAGRLNSGASALPAADSGATERRYCGRFAPSPTGPLHLGSLFTALASYLQARSQEGKWLLRIDDLDAARTVPGAADEILSTLECFGLHWDETVTFQSGRIERYQDAIADLHGKGLLYACTCSRKTLVHLRRYPGHCRRRTNFAAGFHALRLITDDCRVSISDRLQGEFAQDFAVEVGDFIVRRSDGVHAYHLATVVDDDGAGVTEVVRGIDLLESTPRQVLLQRVLGLKTPEYLHVPVLIDSEGIKLSKQTGAAPIDPRKPARTLHALLVLMGLVPPDELREGSVGPLLQWALSHWNYRSLRGRFLQP